MRARTIGRWVARAVVVAGLAVGAVAVTSAAAQADYTWDRVRSVPVEPVTVVPAPEAPGNVLGG
jgi:hypothetical protein